MNAFQQCEAFWVKGPLGTLLSVLEFHSPVPFSDPGVIDLGDVAVRVRLFTEAQNWDRVAVEEKTGYKALLDLCGKDQGTLPVEVDFSIDKVLSDPEYRKCFEHPSPTLSPTPSPKNSPLPQPVNNFLSEPVKALEALVSLMDEEEEEEVKHSEEKESGKGATSTTPHTTENKGHEVGVTSVVPSFLPSPPPY